MKTTNKKYELDEVRLQWLSEETNRSLGQTNFLYNLVAGDWEALLALERQIKRCFVSYCPGDEVEVIKVMAMTPQREWDFTAMEEYCLERRKYVELGFRVRELEEELKKLKR